MKSQQDSLALFFCLRKRGLHIFRQMVDVVANVRGLQCPGIVCLENFSRETRLTNCLQEYLLTEEFRIERNME